MVCSIQRISQGAEALLPFLPWNPLKIHRKPEGMHPKNFCFLVICFLHATLEPWELHDRLHGIHGDNPIKESRKTPPRGGRKAMQGERQTKIKIALLCKIGPSSSDFSLKFTSNLLKTGTTSSWKSNLRCDILFSGLTAENRKQYFRFFRFKKRRWNLLKLLSPPWYTKTTEAHSSLSQCKFGQWMSDFPQKFKSIFVKIGHNVS